jgi:hypothetical protein
MAETFLNGEKRKVDAHIWARGKSMDHADCIIRHLTERGSRDPAGVRHSAQMAWRALAIATGSGRRVGAAARRQGRSDRGEGIMSKKPQTASVSFVGERAGESIMTPRQVAALKRAFEGGDLNVRVVIPIDNYARLAPVPNRRHWPK